MLENLTIFYDSLKCYFFSFFLSFFGIRGQLICMRVGLHIDTQHTEAAKAGRKIELFLKCRTFLQDVWPKYPLDYNKTFDDLKKLGLESDKRKRRDLATNMANCLGHQGCLGCQKLTKAYFVGPNVSMPKRMIGIKNGETCP
jgi:hypothetical protein